MKIQINSALPSCHYDKRGYRIWEQGHWTLGDDPLRPEFGEDGVGKIPAEKVREIYLLWPGRGCTACGSIKPTAEKGVFVLTKTSAMGDYSNIKRIDARGLSLGEFFELVCDKFGVGFGVMRYVVLEE